ncbi:MAG: phenylacetate--CoA ligase family protein [Thermoanaerobaculia bacterium]
MDPLLRLYHLLPAPLRSGAASVRGLYLRSWRYGRETERLVDEAIEREQWSEKQWETWKAERQGFLLHRAATAVPYYTEYWRRRQRQGGKASWQYLENWPVLKKETVRAQPTAFVAEDRDIRSMFHEHTSGTTGTPLDLWWSRETVRAWYALFEARVRRWNAVSRDHRWALLGGQLVAPARQVKPPFWVWNAGLRQLYMSSFHLAPDHVGTYLDALRRYQVTYMLGYASSMYALAQVVLEKGLEAPSLGIAISNAEPLYPWQRQSIAEAFDCSVRDTYGMAEIVCAASECHAGSLHLWPEVGLLEVKGQVSEELVSEGRTGRLICTGLLNADMPLIRYEVGDLGALAPRGKACACNRSLPVLLQVEGRLDDVVLTPDGRRVGRLDPVFKADMRIREAQIIQESLDRIRVKVVPTNGFGSADVNDIIHRLESRLGSQMQILVEPVDRIPRTTAGKFQAVVSLLAKAG